MTRALSPLIICRYLPEVSDAVVRESRRTMASLLLDYRVMPPAVSIVSRRLLEYNDYRLLTDEASQEPGPGRREGWWYRPKLMSDQEAKETLEGVVRLLKEHGFTDEDLNAVLACSQVVALGSAQHSRVAAPSANDESCPH